MTDEKSQRTRFFEALAIGEWADEIFEAECLRLGLWTKKTLDAPLLYIGWAVERSGDNPATPH